MLLIGLSNNFSFYNSRRNITSFQFTEKEEYKRTLSIANSPDYNSMSNQYYLDSPLP